MANPLPNRKPTFRWQAALILLPVFVLAGVGFFSLRQDRQLAEQEARERARTVIDLVAQECGAHLKTEMDGFVEAALLYEDAAGLEAGTLKPGPGQEAEEQVRNGQASAGRWQREHPGIELSSLPQTRCVVKDGALFRPRERDPAPQPPGWFVNLAGPSAEQWNAAEAAWNQRGDTATSRAMFAAIVQSRQRSDDPLRNNAELKLLLLDEASSDPATLFGAFCHLIHLHPRDQTETGLPISALACHEAIRLAPPGRAFEEFLDDFVFHLQNAPSALTGALLAELESRAKLEDVRVQKRVQAIQSVWAAQERARNLLRAVPRGNLARRGVLELTSESGRFIAVCSPLILSGTNANPASVNADGQILLLPVGAVDLAIQNALRGIKARLPDYVTPRLQMNLGNDRLHTGKPASASAAQGNSGPDRTLAAAATGVSLVASGGLVPFTLELVLTDPDLLFARHLQRVRMFGGMILLAAAVAVTGLLAAWKSFHHQLQLAEMKTNFVSSVSHELRAPIASVRLMAESLDRGKIPDARKQAGYFRLIVQECRRLTSLIENVLDFSRIDQGRKQYEFEPANLVALVGQTVKLMEPYAAEREISLSISAPGENVSADVDARAIQQALVNLLDNALKHSPPGTGVVVGLEGGTDVAVGSVQSESGPNGTAPEARQLETAGAVVLLWVEDHGDGIPPGEHDKIFEPFYRRGTELRRETQGIGIGLTIVKHIVEGHGGKVTVRSAPGQGSRFAIELPVNQT